MSATELYFTIQLMVAAFFAGAIVTLTGVTVYLKKTGGRLIGDGGKDVETEVGGVEVNWTHFLTGRDDATIANVSFLSKPKEWHALAVGFAGGVGPAVGVDIGTSGMASGLYSLGRGAKSLADKPGHYKDAAEEPAYTALGFVLGIAARFALNALGVNV